MSANTAFASPSSGPSQTWTALACWYILAHEGDLGGFLVFTCLVQTDAIDPEESRVSRVAEMAEHPVHIWRDPDQRRRRRARAADVARETRARPRHRTRRCIGWWCPGCTGCRAGCTGWHRTRPQRQSLATVRAREPELQPGPAMARIGKGGEAWLPKPNVAVEKGHRTNDG